MLDKDYPTVTSSHGSNFLAMCDTVVYIIELGKVLKLDWLSCNDFNINV